MTAAGRGRPPRREARFRRSDLVIEAVVIVLILTLVVLSPRGRQARPDVAIALARSSAGRVIPAGFLGLSLEYDSVEAYAGSDPQAPNPLFPRLIRNLAPGQNPVVRIGGDSADRTWWPTPVAAQPAGVNFAIDSRWLDVTRELAHSVSARLILGINLEAGSPPVAGAEANAMVSGIGRAYVSSLELGNEPDLYGRFAWYRTPDGGKVTGRPHGYDVAQFTSDFTNTAAALPSGIPLAGPSFGTYGWTPYLRQFLSAEPRLGLVTLHRYPLQRCFIHPKSPRYPTIRNLLSPYASAGLANRFAPYVAIARAHHLPLRIDELNTVACGAVPSVSQSFAAALWALDTLFEFARVGVVGVNIHTFPGAGYNLFHFTHTSSGWGGTVAPEYYGLVMFGRAAPPGSRLMTVTAPAARGLKTWATVARDGTIHVVLIDERTAGRARSIGVQVPGGGRTASLLALRAPSLTATTGASLQNDGTVSPSGDRYTVMLASGSAAMLTIPPAS